jgi:hypothetical protein
MQRSMPLITLVFNLVKNHCSLFCQEPLPCLVSATVRGERGGGAEEAAAAANRQVEVGAEQVSRWCLARARLWDMSGTEEV